MKNYKDFEKVYAGTSDIARLILDTAEGVQHIKFNQDDAYMAYLVPMGTDIGEHYTLVAESKSWGKLYDDSGLTLRIDGPCKFYRAGEYGFIVEYQGSFERAY